MVIALFISSIRHCATCARTLDYRHHSYVQRTRYNRDLQMCSGTVDAPGERETERAPLPLPPIVLRAF